MEGYSEQWQPGDPDGGYFAAYASDETAVPAEADVPVFVDETAGLIPLADDEDVAGVGSPEFPDMQQAVREQRRGLFLKIDPSGDGRNVTEDMPNRITPVYPRCKPPGIDMRHARNLPSSVHRIYEKLLAPGYELGVGMNEDVIGHLDPGECAAMVSEEVNGCTVVAGIARYAGGGRSVLLSHWRLFNELALRATAKTDGLAVTAYGMRSFARSALGRADLEALHFAVVHFSALSQLRLQVPGVAWRGADVMDDLHTVAGALKEAHDIDVYFESYKLAVPGDHSVTVMLDHASEAIFLNDRQLGGG